MYASQRLSFVRCGKRPRERPRSEPDSGNPTVRDRRGACGNVTMGMAIRARKAEMPIQPKLLPKVACSIFRLAYANT